MKKIFSTLVLLVMSSTIVFATPFDDVEGHENFDAIQFVQENGIVNGYDDGTFKPGNRINRAEFTKILILSNYSEEEVMACEFDEDRFEDEGKWFVPYVCHAKKIGWIKGYEDNTFRPAQEINFAEMAKLVAFAELGEDIEPAEGQPWYDGYVRYLDSGAAIPESVERMDHFLTRGEMAEVIFRVKDKKMDRPHKPYEMLRPEAKDLSIEGQKCMMVKGLKCKKKWMMI